MKKKLFVVNTYFQLIIAINLKLKIFKNVDADIIITDTSTNMRGITEKLSAMNIYDNVYFVERKKIRNENKIITFLNFLVSKYNFELPIKLDYDEVLFYNFDILIANIIEYYNNNDKEISISRFEEGYISYFYGDIDSKIVRYGSLIRRFIGRGLSIQKKIKSYYFLEPNFVQFSGNYQLCTIPKISKDDTELKNIYNNLFEINNPINDYKVKNIFFDEVYSFEGKENINSKEILEKLVKIVGVGNIVVKLHPRNTNSEYEGVKTSLTIGIPWEIIQMNGTFSEHRFFTISSGSVLQSKIMFKEPVKTYMLFECCNKRPKIVNKNYIKHLNNIREKYGDDFVILNSIEDIKSVVS